MTIGPYERHIAFDGVFNFRDLGGYRTQNGRTVRWRRLFRSSVLHHITEADVARARDELGLATIIDLREPKAARRQTSPYLLVPPFRYRNVWLIEDIERLAARLASFPVSMAEDYLQTFSLLEFGNRIVAALEAIAEPSACPAVFHCAAGKDRTGMLAAVILGVLGVSDEDIARDYAETARHMPLLVDRWWELDRELTIKISQSMTLSSYDARPETMEAVLAKLRHDYGSMRGYVLAQGAGDALLKRLEDTLLE